MRICIYVLLVMTLSGSNFLTQIDFILMTTFIQLLIHSTSLSLSHPEYNSGCHHSKLSQLWSDKTFTNQKREEWRQKIKYCLEYFELPRQSNLLLQTALKH